MIFEFLSILESTRKLLIIFTLGRINNLKKKKTVF